MFMLAYRYKLPACAAAGLGLFDVCKAVSTLLTGRSPLSDGWHVRARNMFGMPRKPIIIARQKDRMDLSSGSSVHGGRILRSINCPNITLPTHTAKG